MNSHSHAITIPSPRLDEQNVESVRLAKPTVRGSLAVWLIPNFFTAVFAVTLLQVLFLSAGSPRLLHDSDTGWHIRNGEAILANVSVPHADSFSYTRNGEPWFAWEWLSDAVFGALHRTAGLPAIALTAAVLIGLTTAGAAQFALSNGANLFLTAAATAVMLGVMSMHWLARPHLFSWLLALVFLSVSEHQRRRASWKLFALPAVSAVWANMHGSFLLGPAILFTYTIGEWINAAVLRPSRDASSASAGGFRLARNRFALTTLLCVSATFINPYGWRLHQHILAYLQNTYLMDHIQEFRSFDFHSSGAVYVELFLVTAIVGTIALIRQRAFGPALLSMALLHASFYSARHLPMAAVLVLPLSIAALTRESEHWPLLRGFFEYSERLRAIDRRIFPAVPIMLLLILSIFGLNAHAAAGRVDFDSKTFPVKAADFLERNNVGRNGHVFATDQWGGYIIYRFSGQMKVFIDGRSDFYGQQFLETYAQVTEVKPGWDIALKQYDVRFVLLPPEKGLASALQLSPEWKRRYQDTVAAVYERQD